MLGTCLLRAHLKVLFVECNMFSRDDVLILLLFFSPYTHTVDKSIYVYIIYILIGQRRYTRALQGVAVYGENYVASTATSLEVACRTVLLLASNYILQPHVKTERLFGAIFLNLQAFPGL
jgi:hypothetical protein